MVASIDFRRDGQLGGGALFSGAAIICLANAFGAQAVSYFSQFGLSKSIINLFGVNPILIFSCFVALRGLIFLTERVDSAATTRGYAVALVAMAISFVPVAWSGWLGLSLVAAYMLYYFPLDEKSRTYCYILLVATFPLFWGTVLLRIFGVPVLTLDATLTSWVFGLQRIGNTLILDGGVKLTIYWACSSFHNLSYLFLAWLSFSALVQRKVSIRTDWIWIVIMAVGVLALNVGRLGLMALDFANYQYYHEGGGADIFAMTTTAFMVAVCLVGVRRGAQ